MNNNDLTEFNTGGLHEQNKYGGIPVGNNNTVEQGETKIKDFVFSNRLAINEDFVKEMNLPSYIKNKSFAEASKLINNKFKDRNDIHSNQTKKTFLKRLSDAQEILKKEEEDKINSINQSMSLNKEDIQYPEQNQMFMGGNIQMSEIGNQTGGMSGLAGKMSPYLQNTQLTGAPTQSDNMALNPQAKQTWESAKDTVGKVIPMAGLFRGVEKFGKQAGQAIGGDAGGDYASGFLDPMQNVFRKDTNFGEKMLSVMDPIVAGYIANKKNDKKRAEHMNNSSLLYNKRFQDNSFAYGGNLNEPWKQPSSTMSDDPNFQHFLFKPTNTIPQVNAEPLKINPLTDDLVRQFGKTFSHNNYSNFKNITDKTGDTIKNTTNKVGDYLDKNGGKFLRYAPIGMNAFQLSKLKKPDNMHLQRLSDKFVAKYTDDASLQKIIDQEMNNTINAIGQSGASQGAIRNSILATGLNKTKALSDAYMKSSADNRLTDEKALNFNLGVNQFNAQTQHQESENWEKNNAAYRNEKSKYLSAIGTDLGSIGKEEVQKNQIAEALGYDVNGKYVVNKRTGEIKTFEQLLNESEMKNSYDFKNKINNKNIKYTPSSLKLNMYGGNLKK